MIRYLTRRAARQMKRRYDYDATYLEAVADVSSGAAVRLGLLPLLSQYSADVPAELWAGAALGSTLDGDCGPCLQLVVSMARERGVGANQLRAALQGDWKNAGTVGLGMRFAQAAINGTSGLDDIRREIGQRHGESAVATLAIVAASGRTWPVIKRALGHGKACQVVQIDDFTVQVAAAPAAPASSPA